MNTDKLDDSICVNDPENPGSYRYEYDDQDRIVACVCNNDPGHPLSWRNEYNEED